MIPKFTIARIMEEARIEEVVGEQVTLKKVGSALVGLCPFHNEKSPSFSVSVSKGIYKCFGCGKAGNSVTFLMEQQQMTYVEAIRYLAKKYNIEIVEEQVSEEQKKEEELKQSLAESILIVNAFAQRFFTDHLLNHDKGSIGMSYFKERGFSRQTIEKFQLGYAPDSGTALTDAAMKAGYQLDILKKAGLTSSKEDSKYDFFRNRVMFPIHSVTGKVIAYGGRIMVKDEKAPKYVNTPESEVYTKSKILYGIFFARNAIRKLDECLLVEGYTDVISLVQAGIEHVVASSGTALTIEQIRLIKRQTANITVLYDGDQAGIKAALRGMDMILEEGMNVRVVILPDQQDPDSYVRSVGSEEFVRYVKDNRKDVISFKTSLYAKEAKNDPLQKTALVHEIIGSISRIPDPIQRSVYTQQCAERLDMPEQILISEVNKLRRKRAKDGNKDKEEIAPQVEAQDMAANAEVHQAHLMRPSVKTLEAIESNVVRTLMEYGTWDVTTEDGHAQTATQYIFETLEGISFETEYGYIYDYIRQEYTEGRVHEPNHYTLHSDERISVHAIAMLTSEAYEELSTGWLRKFEVVVPTRKMVYIKDIISCTTRLKLYKNLENLKKLEDLMREETDEEKIMKYMRMFKALIREKNTLAEIIGSHIYKPL